MCFSDGSSENNRRNSDVGYASHSSAVGGSVSVLPANSMSITFPMLEPSSESPAMDETQVQSPTNNSSSAAMPEAISAAVTLAGGGHFLQPTFQQQQSHALQNSLNVQQQHHLFSALIQQHQQNQHQTANFAAN